METKDAFLLRGKNTEPTVRHLASQLTEDLRRIVRGPQNELERKLAFNELVRPSVPHDRTINIAYKMDSDLIFLYEAHVTHDKIGTDFLTNQPMYRRREEMGEWSQLLRHYEPELDEAYEN